MTAHDIALYKPCADIDRAYKDSPKGFFMVEQHAQPGGAICLDIFTVHEIP